MLFSYQVATPDVIYDPGMTCMQGDFEESIRFLADCGYTGVELMTTCPKSLDWEALGSVMERWKVRPVLICTGELGGLGYSVSEPVPYRRAQSLQRIREAIDMAAFFGVNINAGRIKGLYCDKLPKEETVRLAAEGFGELSDYAAKKGVSISLETAAYVFMNFINTCAEAENLIQRVNRPNFGLMMDLFHMYVEEPDLVDSIRRYSSYNLHVHLADSNRKAPGKGSMDFKKILSVFRDSGYDGAFTVEVRQEPDSRTAAAEAAAYLLPLFKEIYGRLDQ